MTGLRLRKILAGLLLWTALGVLPPTLGDEVPYAQSPTNVVDTMLSLAEVGPQDFVVDLGSGDGSIVIGAAKRYGARGLGIELDDTLVAQSRATPLRVSQVDTTTVPPSQAGAHLGRSDWQIVAVEEHSNEFVCRLLIDFPGGPIC